jgi:primase-polymerase (primpol)-like protein
VPLTAAGAAASSTDPATWSQHADVRRFERRGFVLNGDGIVCIDLDHCLIEGRLTDMARRLLEQLPRTYIEVSPSGDGLHVWGRGQVMQGRCLPGGVEVYGTGRFMTVTGRRFGRCPAVLGDLSGVLAELMT